MAKQRQQELKTELYSLEAMVVLRTGSYRPATIYRESLWEIQQEAMQLHREWLKEGFYFTIICKKHYSNSRCRVTEELAVLTERDGAFKW